MKIIFVASKMILSHFASYISFCLCYVTLVRDCDTIINECPLKIKRSEDLAVDGVQRKGNVVHLLDILTTLLRTLKAVSIIANTFLKQYFTTPGGSLCVYVFVSVCVPCM